METLKKAIFKFGELALVFGTAVAISNEKFVLALVLMIVIFFLLLWDEKKNGNKHEQETD